MHDDTVSEEINTGVVKDAARQKMERVLVSFNDNSMT